MSTHIVLFLKENIQINYEELVKKLEESFKDLGAGVIFNKENKNPNYPMFIFNKNKKLLIDGNNHHISINILNEYTKIKDEIIESLWDAFDYNELTFTRVGYINEYHKNINNLNELKEKILNEDLINDTDEFQVSFHNNIKFKRKNINCWRRFIKMTNTPLLISYDINSKDETFEEINYKILKELINFSDKYIDEDLIKFIKEENI